MCPFFKKINKKEQTSEVGKVQMKKNITKCIKFHKKQEKVIRKSLK